MDNNQLIKEYFLERFREAFKYPFGIYTDGESIPLKDDALAPRHEVSIHLQGTNCVFLIDLIQMGTIYTNLQNRYGPKFIFCEDIDFDIHSEESMDIACGKIIDQAQDYFHLMGQWINTY